MAIACRLCEKVFPKERLFSCEDGTYLCAECGGLTVKSALGITEVEVVERVGPEYCGGCRYLVEQERKSFALQSPESTRAFQCRRVPAAAVYDVSKCSEFADDFGSVRPVCVFTCHPARVAGQVIFPDKRTVIHFGAGDVVSFPEVLGRCHLEYVDTLAQEFLPSGERREVDLADRHFNRDMRPQVNNSPCNMFRASHRHTTRRFGVYALVVTDAGWAVYTPGYWGVGEEADDVLESGDADKD